SLALNPQSASTHYNLGYALALQHRRDEAIASFREALRIDPAHAEAHNNLAAMLQLAGRVTEALEHYRRAVALRPDNVEARANLGRLLTAQGEERAAASEFREALAVHADDPQALAGLAWVEASSADSSLRDPTDAVRLAERAASLTGRRDLSVLETLAVAYASVNGFEDAMRVADEAAEIAESQGQRELAVRFRQRAEAYRKRRH